MDLEPWDPLDHPARIEVRRQESDDSDAEGGLGNVTRIVLRPPGHSGKAKRGHLCFDASYEGGNLGRVDFISEYEYDLFIRPDTCNPRYRMWFNFVVDNVRADQRVIFNLVNLCKIKTLFRDGLTPLVKTSSRPKWQRLPGKYVYYHKSPEHRNHYILSFAFAFDREEDVYQFAFSFPYSYARLQAHLALLDLRELPFLKRETIGVSLQGRKMEVVTISNLKGPTAGKRPKIVVVLARINPGESPTSYIAQGLMDFMGSGHPIAVALRDHIIIKIVPMINPDGVFLGNYRTSLMGYDLNRHWNQVSSWSHPTLYAIKNYLIDLDASKAFDLDMVIDLHTHASLMGAFIYGNAYDDVYRFERHILFPKLLAHNAEDYNPTHTMYNRDPSKAGTARRHLCEILRTSVNVYTLEASFFGYTQNLSNSIITYNEDGYLRLGRNLARTFFDYYKATGIIPSAILSSGPGGPSNDKKSNDKRRSKGRPNKLASSNSKTRAKRKSSRDKSKSHSQEDGEELKEGNNEDEDPDENENEKGVDKAIVKLPTLSGSQRRSSSSSSSDEGSSSEEVKVRATRNGAILEQQYITKKSRSKGRRRSSSGFGGATNDNDNDKSVTGPANVSNNHNGKSRSGKRGQDLQEQGSSSSVVTQRKAAYQTFDFSILKGENTTKPFESFGETSKRAPHLTTATRKVPQDMRKIGGGGLVGKKKVLRKRASQQHQQGGASETETEAPCLTIIDFNMLIRKALEGRQFGEGVRRGWRGRSSRRAKRKGDGDKDLTGHLTDGSGYLQQQRGRNNIRRRRAIMLRGTVTDCSPWEEEEEASSSADSSSSNLFSDEKHCQLGHLLHSNNKKLRKTMRKSKRRGGKSPGTPTLSPSPIFLPQ